MCGLSIGAEQRTLAGGLVSGFGGALGTALTLGLLASPVLAAVGLASPRAAHALRRARRAGGAALARGRVAGLGHRAGLRLRLRPDGRGTSPPWRSVAALALARSRGGAAERLVADDERSRARPRPSPNVIAHHVGLAPPLPHRPRQRRRDEATGRARRPGGWTQRRRLSDGAAAPASARVAAGWRAGGAAGVRRAPAHACRAQPPSARIPPLR